MSAFKKDRKLDKPQILRLAHGNYIEEHHNIILKGASGNGKIYLACAFGIAACRQFYKVKYVRLPDLLDELAVARGEGIFRKVIKQYKKVNLLILDEWLLTPLRGNEARDLLEIIEARHRNGSTIFCSRFDPRGWHEKIGEETLADAILDRIVHDSYSILIDGKVSMSQEVDQLRREKMELKYELGIIPFPGRGIALMRLVAHPCHRWLYFMAQVAQNDGRAGSIPWQYSHNS